MARFDRFAAALAVAMPLVCSGCDSGGRTKEAPKAWSAAFASISIVSSNSYGGGFSAGVLVVSHATGAISVCWKKCTVIGKTEPSGPQDLALHAADNLKVYVVNVTTGHVVSCQVESDGFVTVFKGGRCDDVGTADR